MKTMKPSLQKGQVVFAKESGEYMRVLRVLLETKSVELFNPRWGGREIHTLNTVRPLTAKEKA